jgi:hypothetical protein
MPYLVWRVKGANDHSAREHPATYPEGERRVPKLEIVPVHWTKWDFNVSSAGRELTRLSLIRFRDRGRFTLNGAEYEVYTQGFLRRSYRMERNGVVVGRAETKGVFRTVFLVHASERLLTVTAKGALGQSYRVEHNRTGLGEIQRVSVLTRDMVATLDDRVDLPTQIFLAFLVQVQWRRAARRA